MRLVTTADMPIPYSNGIVVGISGKSKRLDIRRGQTNALQPFWLGEELQDLLQSLIINVGQLSIYRLISREYSFNYASTKHADIPSMLGRAVASPRIS